MAFIYIFFFFLKKFEKVEKTGIISTKFSLRCTPSVILGVHIMQLKLFGKDMNKPFECFKIKKKKKLYEKNMLIKIFKSKTPITAALLCGMPADSI